MISQTVEYALRAVVTIAQHGGEPCTAQQIAELTRVPKPYLCKLLQGLVRAGLVQSQRGPHGGFVLAKGPTELTFLEVVDAVEPIQRIFKCPLSIGAHHAHLCSMHRRLDHIMETAERMLADTTVALILTEPNRVTPLCENAKTISLDSKSKKPRGKKPRR